MISHQLSVYYVMVQILLTFNDVFAEVNDERGSKLLNVFSVVKFPNEACNSTGGNYYGTCFTATECASLG